MLEQGEDAGGPFLDLADSLYYPGGGGQPADRGWVAGRRLTAVERVGSAWRHWVDAADPDDAIPGPGAPVLLQLDWPRRFDHMQQHSGQHLLSAIAEDRFGWRTTSFHLGEEVCDIELDVPALSRTALHDLEEAVAEAIRTAAPLREQLVEPADLVGRRVRSRGLPAGHQGLVRLVEIEGLDLATCGGTHLAHLGQLEGLTLLGTEALRGGQRLSWIAGSRIRRRLAGREQLVGELRRLLKAPDASLTEAAGRLQQGIADVQQEGRSLAAWLVENLAARLAADPSPWPWLHDPRLTRELQRELGKRMLAAGRTAFLSGGEPPFAWLLVLPPDPAAPHPPDAASLQAWIAALGRGGGQSPFVQGQASSLDALRTAASRLPAWAGSPDPGAVAIRTP